MQGLRLYKTEKLCSRTAINQLFEHGRSTIAYPLRAVYSIRQPADRPAQFLVSVPKKKIRHAVDRVLLRRRTREAYRLWRRTLLHPALHEAGMTADIAFVFLDKKPVPYDTIEERMKQLLTIIARAATSSRP